MSALRRSESDETKHIPTITCLPTGYEFELFLANRDRRISELEAEVAALREDQERLQALIDNYWGITKSMDGKWWVYSDLGTYDTTVVASGPDARAAIDDARAKERGGV